MWRSRLLRYARSDETIAAFCRDGEVITAGFHIWRAKLADGQLAQLAALVDRGAIKEPAAFTSRAVPQRHTAGVARTESEEFDKPPKTLRFWARVHPICG